MLIRLHGNATATPAKKRAWKDRKFAALALRAAMDGLGFDAACMASDMAAADTAAALATRARRR